jgi:hypothetical protein
MTLHRAPSRSRQAHPPIDDLILTKRIAARPKDAEDIRLLERLKEVRDD